MAQKPMKDTTALRRTARLSARALLGAAASAALALALALPAAAPARVTASRRVLPASRSCAAAPGTPAHRSHRSRRCSKRGSHRRLVAHRPKKTSSRPASVTVELVPAACEDGSLPSHAGGGAYSCEDGSAPACETGALVSAAATAAPQCAVKQPPGSTFDCSSDGGSAACPTIEFPCEGTGEGETAGSCARSGEGGAPGPEEEPEEE